jgi:hypothetical protein
MSKGDLTSTWEKSSSRTNPERARVQVPKTTALLFVAAL